MNYNPLVSIIIPTKDCSRELERCLKAIKKQTYHNYEIIVSDGLSTDDTVSIARKYKSRVVKNAKVLAEPGVSLGFSHAKGEILIVMAVDNIFKEINALEKIVLTFKNKKIYAAFPKHENSRNDTLFTKYINIFTDPFNHFVYGYAANARTFNKVYKTLEHNSIFDVFDFKSGRIMPIIALAQGLSVRRHFIDNTRNEMDDITPLLKLIEEGKQIAYVHSASIYHHTVKNMGQFVRKQRWEARNALSGKKYGINSRRNTLTKNQIMRMYLFPFYSLSIIIPMCNAIFHLLKDKEKMWLFHPVITFITGVSIIYEYVRIKFRISSIISRA